MKKIIPGKEFACDLCDKGTKYKIKTTIGEFYQCNKCGCMHK